ncbi:MAG: hypothetical protein ACXWDN_10410 [Limisphaerales bacterium]
MSWLILIIELAVLTLGAWYLYFKQQQRVGNWTPREHRQKWTGHGLDASELKPRVEQVRRDPLSVRQATRGVWFRRYLLGVARRAVVELGYFRHKAPEEHGKG